jgi:pyruvate dehydrogenase E1 component beta subunit
VDAQIAYLIQSRAFDELDAPIHRVSSVDAPQIYCKRLEDQQIPNPARVVAEALKVLA